MATCPDCDFDEIDTEDYDEGETLTCPECGKTLSFLGADEVELADQDDDDLDDLDDEDEDEDEDDDEDDDEEGLEVEEEGEDVDE